MSAPMLAPVRSAPFTSKRLSQAMMRAPEHFAPWKIGASAREMARPEETSRPKRLGYDRSAFGKYARMIQARSSFAPDRFTPERSVLTSFTPKRFPPDRFAR